MCNCGPIGKEMADQVLIRVPLRLRGPRAQDTSIDEAARIRAGDLAGLLKEVNTSCFEHQREGARRTVCKVSYQIRG